MSKVLGWMVSGEVTTFTGSHFAGKEADFAVADDVAAGIYIDLYLLYEIML